MSNRDPYSDFQSQCDELFPGGRPIAYHVRREREYKLPRAKDRPGNAYGHAIE
jgi:hypothetical protein